MDPLQLRYPKFATTISNVRRVLLVRIRFAVRSVRTVLSPAYHLYQEIKHTNVRNFAKFLFSFKIEKNEFFQLHALTVVLRFRIRRRALRYPRAPGGIYVSPSCAAESRRRRPGCAPTEIWRCRNRNFAVPTSDARWASCAWICSAVLLRTSQRMSVIVKIFSNFPFSNISPTKFLAMGRCPDGAAPLPNPSACDASSLGCPQGYGCVTGVLKCCRFLPSKFKAQSKRHS